MAEIKPLDRISDGRKFVVVWAVEPIDEDTLRCFIRPLRKGEK